MFNVSRYDPKTSKRKSKRTRKEESASNKKTKGARNDDDDAEAEEKSQPSLRVIADEAAPPSSQIKTKKNLSLRSAEEAFDDLDLLEELIEQPQPTHDADTVVDEQKDSSSSRSRSSSRDGASGQVSQDEVRTALHMSEIPMDEAARGWKLAPFLLDNLKRDGFAHFFPIQALSIPDVIASERHAHVRAQDVCITAPTGSGKTLSYVLPILNSLAAAASSSSRRHQLRALVILPSRDLATQVYQVFESYVTGSHLKVGIAIGQSDFVAEQKALTVLESPLLDGNNDHDVLLNRLSYDPGDLQLALKVFNGSPFPPSLSGTKLSSGRVPANGWSNVDILVCTPGRLVDHLDNTAGFTLQHLRFLVVDEADRLLSQSYHNWIDRVIESSNSASIAAWKRIVAANDDNNRLPDLQLAPHGCSVVLEPITWRRGGTEGDSSDQFNTNDSYFATAASVCQPIQLRKFLVSATLTRDPQKLAALRLVNPKHFDVHRLATAAKGELVGRASSNRYSMPDALAEYTVECTAEQKPLVLLSLLLERLQVKRRVHDGGGSGKTMIVVFTASLDSTHRLARLLQLLWASLKYGDSKSVGEFSSALSQKERSALMKRCNDPKDKLCVLVCSDGMSRGMDIESVDTVILYDVPALAKTYVHRCGRTARASRKGTAITLLKGGQLSLFSKMRRLIQTPERVASMGIQKDLVRDSVTTYRHCIKALRNVLEAEESGDLEHAETLTEEYIPKSC